MTTLRRALVLEVVEETARQGFLAFVGTEVVPGPDLLPVQGEREGLRSGLQLLAEVWQAPLLSDLGLAVDVVVDEDGDDAVVDQVPPVDAVDGLGEHGP